MVSFLLVSPQKGLHQFSFSPCLPHDPSPHLMPLYYIFLMESGNFYLNINQLDTLNFTISLFHASTCFEHHVLIVRGSKFVLYSLWYHHTCRWPSRAPDFMHKILFYNKFISCFYMFQVPCAHRQDVKNCIIQPLVSSHL